uniref:4Fe-4S Wbl-type domain-containing protein n=1 Tax=Streptomyces sp. NBC_01393 TaxID=2903851 RepID=A0AAU3IE10_9ACTN
MPSTPGPSTQPCAADQVRLLLRRLAPVAALGHCTVCTQPCPDFARRSREFCSTWCRSRAQTLRGKGLLPGGPDLLLPRPRRQRLDLPDGAEVVDLTVRSSG